MKTYILGLLFLIFSFVPCAAQISIGDFAFSNCPNLKSVNLKSDCSLGERVFENSGLESFVYKSVMSGGLFPTTFIGCNNIQKFYSTKDEELTVYNSYNCMFDPAGKRDIIFACCTKTSLPTYARVLEKYAYYKQENLNHVKLPKSLESIGDSTFAYCKNLVAITVEWEIPIKVLYSTFYGIDLSKCTLYCPVGTKQYYEVAKVWRDFGNIVEGEYSPEQDAIFNIMSDCDENVVELHKNLIGLKPGMYKINGKKIKVIE